MHITLPNVTVMVLATVSRTTEAQEVKSKSPGAVLKLLRLPPLSAASAPIETTSLEVFSAVALSCAPPVSLSDVEESEFFLQEKMNKADAINRPAMESLEILNMGYNFLFGLK